MEKKITIVTSIKEKVALINKAKANGFNVASNTQVYKCEDKVIIMNSADEAKLTLYLRDVAAGMSKGGNIMFTNVAEKTSSLYLCHYSKEFVASLEEGNSVIAAYINYVLDKSNDAADLYGKSTVMALTKLNSPRTYTGKIKEGQSARFSIAFSFAADIK